LVDDQLLILEDHLSFENMKKNRAVNYEPFIELFCKSINVPFGEKNFIRNGIVGEGKTKMTPEFVKIFDEWEEKNLKDSGLNFV